MEDVFKDLKAEKSGSFLKDYVGIVKDLGYNVYLSDEFENQIVIGEKSSKLILNKNLKEFYLDKSNIRVIKLK